MPPTHGHPCVSGVGTVQEHGRAFNRAQLLASRHGRAYPATDRALPDLSSCAGFRRFPLFFFISSHVRPFSRRLLDLELFPAKHK